MENFNLKKFLVENKLTTNSKMLNEVDKDRLSDDFAKLKDIKAVQSLIPRVLSKIKGKSLVGDEVVVDIQIAPRSDEDQTVLMFKMESGKVMFLLVWGNVDKFPGMFSRVGVFQKGGLQSKETVETDYDVYLEILNTLYPNSSWKKEDIKIVD